MLWMTSMASTIKLVSLNFSMVLIPTGRQQLLKATNEHTWTSTQDELSAQVSELEAFSANFLEEQAQHYSVFVESLDDLVLRKQEEIEALEAQVLQLESIVQATYSQVGGLIAQQNEKTLALQEAVSEQQEPHAIEMKEHSEKLVSQNATNLDNFESHVDAISGRLQKWSVETQKHDVDECLQLSGKYASSEKNLVSQVQSSVISSVDNSVESYSTQRDNLLSFKESQQNEMKKFQEQLLKSLSDVMSSFMATYDQSLTESSTSLQTQMEDKMQALTEMKTSFVDSIVEVDENTAGFNKKFNQLKESVSSVANQQQQLVDNLSSETRGILKALNEDTVATTSDLNQDIASYNQDLSESLDDFVGRSSLFKETYDAQLNQASVDTTTVSQQLVASLESAIQPLKDNSDVWKQEIIGLKENTESFSSSHASSLELMKESLISFELSKYKQTGSTPVKAPRPSLAKIVGTRPDEEIIAQHRNNGVPVQFAREQPASPVKEEKVDELVPVPEEKEKVVKSATKPKISARVPSMKPSTVSRVTSQAPVSSSRSTATSTTDRSTATSTTRTTSSISRTTTSKASTMQPGKENETTSANVPSRRVPLTKPAGLSAPAVKSTGISRSTTTGLTTKKPVSRVALNSK
eukprot:TRINITY_DN9071_c0_g1_i1.p1 TRINITY_DN9071_c0_g1~~TRINITY_DN9071_c0_g1_i1.p1  ORF type:complete len:638 (-),score=144.90 TRINITY_DN9071_c0_g1_i1:58-1971(-)